jgi:hypothetical protein
MTTKCSRLFRQIWRLVFIFIIGGRVMKQEKESWMSYQINL